MEALLSSILKRWSIHFIKSLKDSIHLQNEKAYQQYGTIELPLSFNYHQFRKVDICIRSSYTFIQEMDQAHIWSWEENSRDVVLYLLTPWQNLDKDLKKETLSFHSLIKKYIYLLFQFKNTRGIHRLVSVFYIKTLLNILLTI